MLKTLEATLCLAVDQLRSRQGLHIPSFIDAHPEYRAELAEHLPVLVSTDRERQNRAMHETCLTVLCELAGMEC